MSAPSALSALTVNGVPIFGTSPVALPCRQPIVGSKVFFVGPNALGLPGAQPSTNFTTLLAAIAALGSRANQGDIIYVLPGHTESISSADYFVNATNNATGYSIIGLGQGPQRPTFTWTTATSSWLMANAGVEIVNCQLLLAGPSATGALTVAAPMTISAPGCRAIGCSIPWGYDADSIVGTGIIVTAADCEFSYNTAIAAVAAVPTATFMTLTAADRFRCVGNYVSGATSGTTVGVIRGLTTASVNMYFADNDLQNILASSTIAFSPLTASTFDSVRDHFFVNSGILPVTGSLGNFFDSKANNTAGKQGALVGTTSS